MVECACTHLDQYLIRCGLWDVDVLDDDFVDPTKFMKQRCAHGSLLRLALSESIAAHGCSVKPYALRGFTPPRAPKYMPRPAMSVIVAAKIHDALQPQ